MSGTGRSAPVSLRARRTSLLILRQRAGDRRRAPGDARSNNVSRVRRDDQDETPHCLGLSSRLTRYIRCWFASLHNTPVAADRSAPIVSVIMRQAEVYGYRPEDTNPCAGIKRYRRQGRERFLSTAEVRRLAEVLTRHEADHPQAVAIIRLLLLTGCRKGEIVSLKWSFYREGKLFLPDSKSGPRTVWLSSDARAILDSLPRAATWIFPSPQTDSHLNGETVRSVWCRVC